MYHKDEIYLAWHHDLRNLRYDPWFMSCLAKIKW